MEAFQSPNMFFSSSIWFLFFHFSSLFFLSTTSDYTLPDYHFINCGSNSTHLVYGRNFAGDENYVFSSTHHSRPVEEVRVSANKIYHSARVFNNSFSYEFDLHQNGTYMVRLHFYPLPSLGNLSDARFSVLASGFRLLSNFTVPKNCDFPLLEEFLLKFPVGKLRIDFLPDKEQSFAFINAIEIILAPPDFIPDSAHHVTRGGGTEETHYDGVLNGPLRVVHRIDVGGKGITPNNDTMLRYWNPDDDYLLHKETARNSEVYADRPNYLGGGATVFDAPDSVYNTAKEMNIGDDDNSLNDFNISWRFDVQKGAKHLIRLHFCDIVSRTTNELFKFNLYIYNHFSLETYPYGVFSELAAPFYKDFVVDSDDSGFMNISIGPNWDSQYQTAFLNGVEIMELIEDRGSAPGGSDSARKRLLIIICSGVGGVILVLIFSTVLFLGAKRRNLKPVQAFDWPLATLHGGSSFSRTTGRTDTGFRLDLNLNLKVPLSEILFATKQFDTRLMIGEGGFGKVYKGMLRNGTKVAVKRSEPGHGQGLLEFQTEIKVLTKIRHHHLVSLIGYCDERNEMILVYEFMEQGNLRDHLYNLHGESKRHDSTSQLLWDQRLQICIGAAKGLHYLHTGSTGTVIHRDIKSTNILLDENYVAKVGDFGLSRSGPLDQTHVSTDIKGSFGYLDLSISDAYN